MKKVFGFILFFLPLSGFKNSDHFLKESSCLMADIVIVCDWSASIRNSEFFQKEAIADFVNNFEISERNVRIGIIEFADSAEVPVPLSGDLELLTMYLWKIKNKEAKGNTNLLIALDSLIYQMRDFNLGGRARKDVPKIALIISDGLPSSDTKEIITKSEILKGLHGVKIFCVYACNLEMKNENLLETISSPDCFLKTNYESLQMALKNLDICF